MEIIERRYKMDETYRYDKKLQKIGNSVGITIPKLWFRLLGNYKVKELILIIDKKSIILLPKK